jgi:hypothetical protein
VNLTESHVSELRVPVRRARVEVHTELERRCAVIFLAPECSPEDLLESDTPFFPAEERGAVRLFARSSVVSVVVDAAEAPLHSLAAAGVSYERRSVAVHLRTGKMIAGVVMALSPFTRMLDLANQPSRSLAVHALGRVHYIAKAYVERIEELR